MDARGRWTGRGGGGGVGEEIANRRGHAQITEPVDTRPGFAREGNVCSNRFGRDYHESDDSDSYETENRARRAPVARLELRRGRKFRRGEHDDAVA